MGAYLSEPVTEKQSVDESLKHLTYGASCMQGWRMTQEDAHNCIPEFDDETSFFAVYDGHGGAEVAQYCAMYFPEFLKNTEAFKQGNLGQALEDAFLGFDATLIKPDVIRDLKALAGVEETSVDSEDENDAAMLYEEATMPIEELMARYGHAIDQAPDKKRMHLRKPNIFRSPDLSGKRTNHNCVDNEQDLETEILQPKGKGGKGKKSANSSKTAETEVAETKVADNENEPGEVSVPSSTENKDKLQVTEPSSVENKDQSEAGLPKIKTGEPDMPEADTNSSPRDVAAHGESGDAATSHKTDECTSSTGGTSETDISQAEEPGSSNADTFPPKDKTAADTIREMLTKAIEEEGGAEDEGEDEEYIGNLEEEDDDDDDDEEEDDEDDEMDEEDDSEEDVEEEEAEGECEDEENGELEDNGFFVSDKEEPGYDSGCTAVVVLLRGRELYVANAGDSRCVVCRNGEVIEMSSDHKPEDETEKTRIRKAGGRVTAEGRVNGGLNLSRAIGDHAYKRSRKLSAKDQMITALPDIRTLTVEDDDEFMIIACDGIWNSLSSKECITYVREKFESNPQTLSSICESLFDMCIAPDTTGDGTGCDNMTCIVVKFKPEFMVAALRRGKRPCDDCELFPQNSSKKCKVDTGIGDVPRENEVSKKSEKSPVSLTTATAPVKSQPNTFSGMFDELKQGDDQDDSLDNSAQVADSLGADDAIDACAIGDTPVISKVKEDSCVPDADSTSMAVEDSQ